MHGCEKKQTNVRKVLPESATNFSSSGKRRNWIILQLLAQLVED
jgi:hypothetical protein